VWTGHPDSLLGCRVSVLWAGGRWFDGTVTESSADGRVRAHRPPSPNTHVHMHTRTHAHIHTQTHMNAHTLAHSYTPHTRTHMQALTRHTNTCTHHPRRFTLTPSPGRAPTRSYLLVQQPIPTLRSAPAQQAGSCSPFPLYPVPLLPTAYGPRTLWCTTTATRGGTTWPRKRSGCCRCRMCLWLPAAAAEAPLAPPPRRLPTRHPVPAPQLQRARSWVRAGACRSSRRAQGMRWAPPRYPSWMAPVPVPVPEVAARGPKPPPRTPQWTAAPRVTLSPCRTRAKCRCALWSPAPATVTAAAVTAAGAVRAPCLPTCSRP
jgi:hypothetical protein